MDKRRVVRGIIVRNNKIILMYRQRLENNKLLKYYSLPGGEIESNETKEQALVREVREEFNINVKVLDYLGFRENYNNYEYFYKCSCGTSSKLEIIGEEKEISNKNNLYVPVEVDINEIDNLNIRYKDIIKKGLI